MEFNIKLIKEMTCEACLKDEMVKELYEIIKQKIIDTAKQGGYELIYSFWDDYKQCDQFREKMEKLAVVLTFQGFNTKKLQAYEIRVSWVNKTMFDRYSWEMCNTQ